MSICANGDIIFNGEMTELYCLNCLWKETAREGFHFTCGQCFLARYLIDRMEGTKKVSSSNNAFAFHLEGACY